MLYKKNDILLLLINQDINQRLELIDGFPVGFDNLPQKSEINCKNGGLSF